MGKLGTERKSLWPVSRESVRTSCIMYLSTAVVTECTGICRLSTG